MRIPLDRQAYQPVYLQIRDRLKQLIQSGTLKPGDRLPSVRVLAKEAQVNKLTVIEAYSVLEAEGLVYARPGSGYFVSYPITPSPGEGAFSPTQDVIIPQQPNHSFVDSYLASLQAHQQPDIVDFSSGFPCASGLDDLKRIARRAMNDVAEKLFHYDFPQGQHTLRTQIAQLLIQCGLGVSPEHIIVTNGSKQGLSLALSYYVQPGDWVIVECPTYHGALAILENRGARIIGIPMTAEGMNLDLLDQYLRTYHPKLIYTVSTLHNPTGLTTSQAHRQQLLSLAEQYGCLVLEDNAYEGLNFEPVPAPIKALDRLDLVTYLGTFSKTLMPGLRVGYMVVTGQHYQPLVEQKLLQDLHTPTPSQAIVSEYLASGHYRHRLHHLQTCHLRDRNTMLQALERHFPQEATWTVPKGGLFLWVQVPDTLPLEEICQQAIADKVLVTPGYAFFPGRCGYAAMRLNFSQSTQAIESGIAILGQHLKAGLRR